MRLLVATITFAMAIACAACGTGPADAAPAIRPLGDPPTTEHPPAEHLPAVDLPAVDPAPEGRSSPSASGDSTSGGPVAAADDEVRQLLARYDAALTALYENPPAAGDDTSSATRAWLEVVVPGSQLDREVRGRILASGRDDGVSVRAPADGATSFVNSATDVVTHLDGSITWTNCGFSPGVGIRISDGEVVDDSRAVTSGSGRAVRQAGGALVVAELWDDSTEVLGSDATNPCGRAR